MAQARAAVPGGPARPRRERVTRWIASPRERHPAGDACAGGGDPGGDCPHRSRARGGRGCVTGARARPPTRPTPTPLSVTMTLLSPSTLPTRGVLTISGIVKNESKESWTDINVAPFLSSEPITTRDELDEAAASAPDTFSGNRLTDPEHPGARRRPRPRQGGHLHRAGARRRAGAPGPRRLLDRRARPRHRHRTVATWRPTGERARSSRSCRSRWPACGRCRCPSYSLCATGRAGLPTAASTVPPAGCT